MIAFSLAQVVYHNVQVVCVIVDVLVQVDTCQKLNGR